jgi:hypothetical protein
MADTIVKYHGERGACLYDVDRQDWARDDEQNLIQADPRTGKPLNEIERCPDCRRPMPRR